MHNSFAVIAVGLVAVAAGCRSGNPRMGLSDPQRERIENLKSKLRDYKHVLLVCIFEDYWQDKGSHEYSLHRFKATVVRTFKGDWSVSEKVTFVHGVDGPARTTLNGDAGALMFLFTNEHTKNEIGVDAGDFCRYDLDGEREMQLIFRTATVVPFDRSGVNDLRMTPTNAESAEQRSRIR